MVSIPKAPRDVKPYNHFTPGPSLYNYESANPDKRLQVKIGYSKRKLFDLPEGPEPGRYTVHTSVPTKGTYMGYKPIPYGLPIRHPSPAEYSPQAEKIQQTSPRYSIARRRSLSPSDEKLGPAYYNKSVEVRLPNLKFPTAKRLFFDNLADETPGPQKYHPENAFEERSPKYSFTKDGRKGAGNDASQSSPGPGAYQVGDTFSKRGAIIPKKKSETSHSAKKPGPGTYNIGGEIASPERGVRFTKGKRSYDNKMPTPGPQHYVDINMPLRKAPVTIFGTSKRQEDLMERSPGPGMYNPVEENFGNYKHKIFIRGKPKDYLDVSEEIYPSPQHYSPRNLTQGPSVSITKGPRDYQLNPLEVPPGPGAYSSNSKLQYRFAFTHGKRTQFQPLQNPGPGEYSLKSQLDQSVEKAKYRPKPKGVANYDK